jgi:hypothetical protein
VSTSKHAGKSNSGGTQSQGSICKLLVAASNSPAPSVS